MDIQEIEEVALHLYLHEQGIKVRNTRTNPYEIYSKDAIELANKSSMKIKNMIALSGLSRNEISLLSCGFGGLKATLSVLRSLSR